MSDIVTLVGELTAVRGQRDALIAEIQRLRGELAECERVGGKFMEEIERLRGHINWLNDANDGGRLAINEIERLREQLGLGATGAKALADAKEEIARLRKELAEKDDYIRTVSRPIGAWSYE